MINAEKNQFSFFYHVLCVFCGGKNVKKCSQKRSKYLPHFNFRPFLGIRERANVLYTTKMSLRYLSVLRLRYSGHVTCDYHMSMSFKSSVSSRYNFQFQIYASFMYVSTGIYKSFDKAALNVYNVAMPCQFIRLFVARYVPIPSGSHTFTFYPQTPSLGHKRTTLSLRVCSH